MSADTFTQECSEKYAALSRLLGSRLDALYQAATPKPDMYRYWFGEVDRNASDTMRKIARQNGSLKLHELLLNHDLESGLPAEMLDLLAWSPQAAHSPESNSPSEAGTVFQSRQSAAQDGSSAETLAGRKDGVNQEGGRVSATLNRLQAALALSAPWNGDRPVLVERNGEVYEIGDIADMGAQRCVILRCKSESNQKVHLPPSWSNNGIQSPDDSAPNGKSSLGSNPDLPAQTSPQRNDEKSQSHCDSQADPGQNQQSTATGNLPCGETLAGREEGVNAEEKGGRRVIDPIRHLLLKDAEYLVLILEDVFKPERDFPIHGTDLSEQERALKAARLRKFAEVLVPGLAQRLSGLADEISPPTNQSKP